MVEAVKRGRITMPWLLSWHRRFGLVALVGMVLWCLSGVLHPIMVQFQPVPAAFRLNPELPQIGAAVDPAAALAVIGIREVIDLRLVGWQGAAYYQATLPGRAERDYISVFDGRLEAAAERRHAEHLARYYSGDYKASVNSVRLVTDFDYEYTTINRLLPVWRVEFDRPDGLRVYVDTRTGKLGSLVDRIKAFSSWQFEVLHKWSWLAAASPSLRLAVLSIMLVASLAMTVIGLWIYGLRWRYSAQRWNLRRLHRTTGVALSIAALMFTASGLYHLLHMGLAGDPADRYRTLPAPISVDRILVPPARALAASAVAAPSELSLVQLAGEPAWRILDRGSASPLSASSRVDGTDTHAGHAAASADNSATRAVLVSATDGRRISDGERERLLALVRGTGLAEPLPVLQSIDGFNSEYGFAFKRLPVERVELTDGRAVFIDPADSVIAAVVGRADRVEDWVFSYIHKLEWLKPILTGLGRDIVAAFLALALGFSALLGGILYIRRLSRG